MSDAPDERTDAVGGAIGAVRPDAAPPDARSLDATPPEAGPRDRAWPLDGPSLQERYAPSLVCFGCGPANPQGLRIRSFPAGNGEVVATWIAAPHHVAFPGMLNGGIAGALLDCHSNWTAAYHLMRRAELDHPPATVTADYHVRFRRPTPTDGPLTLRARVAESGDDRATVEATLEAHGDVTATCRGTFVAVKPGHHAFHRW